MECVTNRKDPNTTLRIHGIEYDVVEQLTMATRGRWKVWSPNPEPDGTLFTIIDVLDSPVAVQLQSALRRLPQSVSGIPRLVDFDRVDGRLRMVVSWCEGIDLESYLARTVKGKSFRPTVWETIRRVKAPAA